MRREWPMPVSLEDYASYPSKSWASFASSMVERSLRIKGLRLDDLHIIDRLVRRSSLHRSNLVDHIHAVDYLPEDCVFPYVRVSATLLDACHVGIMLCTDETRNESTYRPDAVLVPR